MIQIQWDKVEPDLVYDELLKYADFFSCISHANGRIRLRISPKITNAFKESSYNDSDVELSQILDLIEKIAWVKSIKLNKLVGSLILEYDSKKIPKDVFEEWLAKKDSEILRKTIVDTLTDLQGLA